MFTIYMVKPNAFINFKNDKNDEKVRAINKRGEILVMNYFLKNIVLYYVRRYHYFFYNK